MIQLGLIWRLNIFFLKKYNETDSIGTMMDEAMVSKHTSPCCYKQYFSHDAKCKYSFSKLFYQIMGLSMK
jgi:hypothetical protein